MNNRSNLFTRVAPYADRLTAWKHAIESAERHVSIGITLQSQGGEILQSKDNVDQEEHAKLIQQATATIKEGVRLERDARDKLIELYQQQPREK